MMLPIKLVRNSMARTTKTINKTSATITPVDPLDGFTRRTESEEGNETRGIRRDGR